MTTKPVVKSVIQSTTQSTTQSQQAITTPPPGEGIGVAIIGSTFVVG